MMLLLILRYTTAAVTVVVVVVVFVVVVSAASTAMLDFRRWQSSMKTLLRCMDSEDYDRNQKTLRAKFSITCLFLQANIKYLSMS